VFVLLLLAMAVIDSARREFLQAGFFAVCALLLVRGLLKSRGLSATPVLLRAAITRIEAHAPVAPVTRAHFIVHFTQDGQALRRFVILPGTLEGGTSEYARALELLKREGLPLSP
jgi:hypothetical protein